MTTLQAYAKRVIYWETYHRLEWNAPTIRDPYRLTPHFEALYRDKDVLEMGPGDGRQFAELSPLARTYTVADIVPMVLAKLCYATVPRLCITSWETAWAQQWETICFWYVFHHVIKTEASAFMAFIVRHLRPDGTLHFNTPLHVPNSRSGGDGLGTTDWHLEEIAALIEGHGLFVQTVIGAHCDCLTWHISATQPPAPWTLRWVPAPTQ
jgi:hypothetical protein